MAVRAAAVGAYVRGLDEHLADRLEGYRAHLQARGQGCQEPRVRQNAAAEREGRPVRASVRSARVMSAVTALTPTQRSGSGSQRLVRARTQGSAVRGVSCPSTRSATVWPAR